MWLMQYRWIIALFRALYIVAWRTISAEEFSEDRLPLQDRNLNEKLREMIAGRFLPNHKLFKGSGSFHFLFAAFVDLKDGISTDMPVFYSWILYEPEWKFYCCCRIDRQSRSLVLIGRFNAKGHFQWPVDTPWKSVTFGLWCDRMNFFSLFLNARIHFEMFHERLSDRPYYQRFLAFEHWKELIQTKFSSRNLHRTWSVLWATFNEFW